MQHLISTNFCHFSIGPHELFINETTVQLWLLTNFTSSECFIKHTAKTCNTSVIWYFLNKIIDIRSQSLFTIWHKYKTEIFIVVFWQACICLSSAETIIMLHFDSSRHSHAKHSSLVTPLYPPCPHSQADGHLQAAACHSYPLCMSCTCSSGLCNGAVRGLLGMLCIRNDARPVKTSRAWVFSYSYTLKRIN